MASTISKPCVHALGSALRILASHSEETSARSVGFIASTRVSTASVDSRFRRSLVVRIANAIVCDRGPLVRLTIAHHLRNRERCANFYQRGPVSSGTWRLLAGARIVYQTPGISRFVRAA